MKTRSYSAALALTLALSACEEPAPPPRFPISFTADSDGSPLAGVQVLINDELVGETDGEGRYSTVLVGPEGSPVQATAQCPEGHRSPAEPSRFSLRQVVSLDPRNPSPGIQVGFSCPPELRHAVLVIRTDDRAELPVEIDAREATRTDRSGAAHVSLTLAPQASFTVRLRTDGQPRLRPETPSQTFTMPDHDQIFVLDQTFQEERPPRRRRRRRRVRQEPPTVPRPINITGQRR